ncbi:MAG: CCA tRNA nucleotidyltransferase [Chloroflexi bacterium CFX4]|nr:CCA tRNA nucleotidyltransferase [Chloroflexi bacterium CFX4]MDL1922058.1 CCA tRNA nucleotidyltransferase [Chloroflexi bacterium CFX3]
MIKRITSRLRYNLPMPDFLDIPERLVPLLRVLAETAKHHATPLYVVGGFVRDNLLKLPTYEPDLDLVAVGNAPALVKELAAQHGGSFTAHPPFGTATWHLPSGMPMRAIDFATTRTEIYATAAALPTVTLISGADALQRDAHRRDFSVNTLAMQLAPEPFGALIDPLGALPDLHQGVLRTLHPHSFSDDPTRLLRAARFVARLGFRLAAESIAELPQGLPHIAALSGERLRHEFDLIFAEEMPHVALRWLAEHGVLAAIDPRLTFDERLESAYPALRALRESPPDLDHLAASWALFGSTFPDDAALLERLALPKATHRAVAEVRRARLALACLEPTAPPSQITRALVPFCTEAVVAAALIGTPTDRDRVWQYLTLWRYAQPAADGNFLRSLGLKPSPLFGRLLSRLRDALLDGEVSSPEAQRALLKEWVNKAQDGAKPHEHTT